MTESLPPPNPAELASRQTLSQRLEPLPAADYPDYTLHAAAEIRTILRAMIAQQSLVTIYFNQGRDFFLSTLLQLDDHDQRLWLDVGSDDATNRRALNADRLVCVAQLERIRIQFVLQGLDSTQLDRHPAFLSAPPATLLRLQRRESYRFVMPVLQPLKCLIPVSQTADRTETIEVHIVDISGGGVGILSKSQLKLDIGQVYEHCQIELPGIGLLEVSLRVRSQQEITSRTGATHSRLGCQFIGLRNPQEMQVQRYIIKAERERKTRELG